MRSTLRSCLTFSTRMTSNSRYKLFNTHSTACGSDWNGDLLSRKWYQLGKRVEACRFFPNCKKGDQCPFDHSAVSSSAWKCARCDANNAATTAFCQACLANKPRPIPSPADVAKQFTVLQFNVLAHGLSCPEADYGGFDGVPKDCLAWPLRRHKLMQVVLESCADIVALEECDHFDDFFAPELAQIGFEGHFVPKPSAPAAKFGVPYVDGCAILFNTALFKREDESPHVFHYPNSSQVAIAVALQSKVNPKQQFVVVATHLKAKSSFEELRRKQVSQLLDWLTEVFPSNVPIVVCGDFNDDPQSLAVAEMKSHSLNFKSTYELALGHEPTVTTAKWRGDRKAVRCIDYIFFTPSRGDQRLTLTQVLLTPEESDLPSTLLPNYVHPSDHLHLACKFQFNK